jgi:hypothetical protein
LVNGKLFEAMSKHIPANTANSIYSSSNQSEQQEQPFSPMQWGNPETIQKLLVDGSSDGTIQVIHFERWVVKIPHVEPQSLLGKN